MPTLCKRGARKLAAAGPLEFSYVNLQYPMLSQRKHVAISIGNHPKYDLRIQFDSIPAMISTLQNLYDGYKDET